MLVHVFEKCLGFCENFPATLYLRKFIWRKEVYLRKCSAEQKQLVFFLKRGKHIEVTSAHWFSVVSGT